LPQSLVQNIGTNVDIARIDNPRKKNTNFHLQICN